ncbi:hypothetical protein INT43_007497 [Umbelopsis isabellina]|uniref:Uncharacterized protein n=1 Tax=Mortierella isabellina TaxID=91625 RepID=A0A8H7Q0P5_MORIS|nr:hypothetical protein INT43_007497 [Umbelopsis isabellina]
MTTTATTKTEKTGATTGLSSTTHTAERTTTSHSNTEQQTTTTQTTSSEEATKTEASTMYLTNSAISSIAIGSLNVSALLGTNVPTSTFSSPIPSSTPNGVDCSLDTIHAVNGVCNSGYYCNVTASTCLTLLANGSACTMNSSCVSTHCMNGICSIASTNATSTTPDDQGLSKGAVAGVAVGSITGAAAVLALAAFFLRRRRPKKKFNRGKGITPSMVFSDADASSRFSLFGNLNSTKTFSGDMTNSMYSFASPTAAIGSVSPSPVPNAYLPSAPSEKTTATIDYYYNIPGGIPPPAVAKVPNARQSTRSSAARLSKYNYLAQAFTQMRTSYAANSSEHDKSMSLETPGNSMYNSRDALRAGSIAADSLSQALDESAAMPGETESSHKRDSDVIPKNFNQKQQARYQMQSMYSTFSRDSDIIEPATNTHENIRTSGFAAMNPSHDKDGSAEAGPQTANQIELSPMVGEARVSPVVPRITIYNEHNEEEGLDKSHSYDNRFDMPAGMDYQGSFRGSFMSDVSHFSVDSNPFRAPMAANNSSTDAWTQEDGDINKTAHPPSSNTYNYF